jgi:hypothetical protein
MNLYIRYFGNETLVYNVQEAIDFLANIPAIGMNRQLEADIRAYAASDVVYPKRYKVRQRAYFIIIKTVAETMADFKQKKGLRAPQQAGFGSRRDLAATAVNRMTEVREGWYEGKISFKRVVTLPSTGKHQYRDTTFVARCKAVSGQDCYDRIVEHLKSRVDSRSQFPSAKGKNFSFKYLGMWK